MVQKTASARTFSEIFKFDCHLVDFEQSNPINWQNKPAHNHYFLNCWSFCNHTLMIHHYELECKRISSLENKGDLTLGTPRRPEAQSGLTVRPAGKVQCQGGRTKPYRPHLHWSKLHLWRNTISRLLGFQTHTQDMHPSLFCVNFLSTNLGSGQNKMINNQAHKLCAWLALKTHISLCGGEYTRDGQSINWWTPSIIVYNKVTVKNADLMHLPQVGTMTELGWNHTKTWTHQ